MLPSIAVCTAATVLHELQEGVGQVGVLALKELRAVLDDGDAAAKAAHGLGEFEWDLQLRHRNLN
jgi:hypothetical protein